MPSPSDDAVARAISRPTVLDRYQPHLHRRWNQGCHDTAVLHAEITALGYRGSLRTVYRYLQPLRAGAAAPLTLPALKIGEVTSWLLRRAEDLDPWQQQLLADVRGHCAQLDRLAGNVTSFAKMMTRRTGQQDLAGWLQRGRSRRPARTALLRRRDPPGPGRRHRRAHLALQLRRRRGQRQPANKAIKRQMYGRASLDLPRKRVIHHPP